MKLAQITLRGLVLVAVTTSLTACDRNSAQTDDPASVTSNEKLVVTNEVNDNDKDSKSEQNPLAAVIGTSEIPYPMYPNGTKYRVGGENGLKIVVFQTEDTFAEVDEYYNSLKNNAGMARITAMSDYVRYSSETDDVDPWANDKPGIVIHEFEDEDAREAVGANALAKTNIIMSF